MTEASITALALEESLLKEWSAFHERVDQSPPAPGTHEQAERTASYARNGAFVDSIIDALSLYLAGRSEFDSKFLSYLDLTLIQRGQEEDVAILLKLASKHASEGNLIGLMGLLHRLRLYGGDPRLAPAIEFCASGLQQFDEATDNLTWARSVGIEPTDESWNFSIRLGTAPVGYWVSRKSALKREDVSLELLVTEPGQWRVQVARVDRSYSAQWRPSGITIDTDVLRLKPIAAWPTFTAQRLFPVFVNNLADFLKVTWTRTAWLTVNDAKVDRVRLLEWLQPCVDELTPDD